MNLEKAISITNAGAFSEVNGSIIIDRGGQRSRDSTEAEDSKENKIKRTKSTKPRPFSQEVVADPSTNLWKEKYFEMKALRADAENELDRIEKLSKEREESLEKYSGLLEQKIAFLEGERMKPDETSGELEKTIKMLKFYEMMTSMSVKEENGQMICTVKNKVKRIATRFVLNIEGADLEYAPRGNIEHLPDYMKNELVFERTLAPVLLADVLQKLNEDKSDD